MLALCLMLFATYYAQNYASIIGCSWSLVEAHLLASMGLMYCISTKIIVTVIISIIRWYEGLSQVTSASPQHWPCGVWML